MKSIKYVFLGLIAVFMLTAFAPVAVPSGPRLVSPIKNAVKVDPTAVTLLWAASVPTKTYTIDDYEVEISDSSAVDAITGDFSSTIGVATVAAPIVQYAIPALTLDYGGTYYWHVRANDSLPSTSAWSVTGVFRVAVEPPTIVPLVPADLYTLRPTFVWVPGAQNADSYTLQLSTDSGFSKVYSTATILYTALPPNQYTLTTDLPPQVKFYWRVRANSVVSGTSDWSSPYGTFTTANPPTIPILVSPKSVRVSPTPVLSWKAVSLRALTLFETYEVEIFDTNIDVNNETPVYSAKAPLVAALATQGTGTVTYTVPVTANLLPATTYYWRINAYNQDDEYSSSVLYAFFTSIAGKVDTATMNPGEVLGNVPGLEDPADVTAKVISLDFLGDVHENANLLGLNPTFKWGVGTLNAQTYTLQVASVDSGSCNVGIPGDSKFSTLIINTTIAYTSSGYTSNLTSYPNEILCWRIRGNHKLYGSSDWSDVQIFRTANPPSVPVPSAPKDGTLTNDNSPRLSWGKVTVPSSAFGKYEVEVSYSKTFTGYTYPADTLPPFTDVDSASYPLMADFALPDESVNDPIYSVAKPQPLFPLYPMVDQAHDPVTELANSVEESYYDFQPEHVLLPAGDPLYGAHTYYWRVRSYNSEGEYSAWSLSRSIRITPDRPTNLTITDCDGVTVTDPLSPRPCFDWGDVYGVAGGYIFQIATKDTFIPSSIVVKAYTGSQYQPVKDLPKDVDLYWSVVARGSITYGTSLPAVASFHSANPPETPKLIAPILNKLEPTTTPTFIWSTSFVPFAFGFDHYEIQIAKDSNFTYLVEPTSQTTAGDESELTYTIGVGLLDPGKTYYWRVRSCNDAIPDNQCSTWSPGSSFRIAIEQVTLGAALLTTPLRPIFDWDVVGGATSYTIRISLRPACDVPVLSATVASLSYQPKNNLTAGTTYYWCVIANSKTYGPGAWSAVDTFMTP